MTKLKFIYLFFILLILGCETEKKNTQNNLIGKWSKIEKVEDNDYPPPPGFNRPFGIGFTEDKIELFNGFQRYDQDSVTGKRQLNYKGTFTDYKVKNDSIFILNPFNENWEFKWKIKGQLNDTLILTKNNTTFIKLQRIKEKKSNSFDQIIFSSSGCYGSCPIIDISINNKNKIYFQGEGYVKPLGFYESLIDSIKTDYIFSKFAKANIDSLKNEYAVGHTDDESITTTFVKNGQIIKTIHDYGKAGPKELIWAYVPIQNLHTEIELDSIENDEPFYPKLHYYTFVKDSKILRLEKSESFFLWTEIKDSKIVNTKFNSKYSIGFRGNYTYWGADPNEKRKHLYELDKIESDGKLFKFSFKDQKSITYDLDYDFIERNYKETDFKNKTKFD
ncbi:DUF6438 domain-containing protein [Formosa algae]|uniref:DUF6438 domain-containing protein n=1 Tax=Formosa algae TaxID=225843 RepID=A0A9X1CBG5_9FLAO|nr:DUF6438 domain-containing protein [Formosa algae]MBP1840017.1 hypothetical protein [Formosa algae]MDQ0335616.1 hypothetical protein [Formosa algae]